MAFDSLGRGASAVQQRLLILVRGNALGIERAAFFFYKINALLQRHTQRFVQILHLQLAQFFHAGPVALGAGHVGKVEDLIQQVPAENRTARFVSAVCFILPNGRELLVKGECPGTVAFSETGTNGFGYDPLFVPDRVGLPDGTTAENTACRSYAELADGEKDAISHRGRAMEKLEAELPAFLAQD